MDKTSQRIVRWVHAPPSLDPHPYSECEAFGHLDPRDPAAPAGRIDPAIESSGGDGPATQVLLRLGEDPVRSLIMLCEKITDMAERRKIVSAAQDAEVLDDVAQEERETAQAALTLGALRVALTAKERRAFDAELAGAPLEDLPAVVERWRQRTIGTA